MTTNKPTHTPTPWHTGKAQNNKTVIYGAGCQITEINTSAPDPGENEANAAYIVRAVNAHQELVTLLKYVGNWLEVHLELGHINAGTGNRDGDFVSQIRSAIAKAEKGE